MEMSSPRNHHYIFAHQALPAMFFDDSANVLAALAQQGNGFLNVIWNKIGEQLDTSERLSAIGLKHQVRITEDGKTVALITLPPPQGITEAYFVALIFQPQKKKLFLTKKPAYVRYITLEYGMNLDGIPRTVLGEWNRKGHLNMGDGPEVELEAFFKEVCNIIKEQT